MSILNQNSPIRSLNLPRYADLQTNLVKHPLTNDISMNFNDNAIARSIRNILITNKGERRLDPEFGAGLRDYLFELFTPALIQTIKFDIKHAINTYEPRAIINTVDVSASPDNNSLSISVVFTTINDTEPRSVEVILDRIR